MKEKKENNLWREVSDGEEMNVKKESGDGMNNGKEHARKRK